LRKAASETEEAEEAIEEIVAEMTETGTNILNCRHKKGQSRKEKKILEQMEHLRSIRTMLRDMGEGKEVKTKRRKKMFKRIKSMWGTEWKVEQMDSDEIEKRIVFVNAEVAKARKLWRHQRKEDQGQKSKARWRKNAFKTIKEMLTDVDNEDPKTVMNPETQTLTNKPEEVKNII
jgi:hypothetical protein